ncbi:DUF1656 domain-containing protein [Dankookia rubra]|uniref:DUF1656 domain-containing protein n=1 Tax=Dankookia rubra TaxID=1442381 RepID=A0A4R5Q6B1_9PROT|nr:DUF1656 domain-containing protein [Dankookia rubra]TDH57978.1 DUF1656 domain-containing protein [Dankookia rubra]
MIGEIDLHGVFVPALLAWAALALPANALLRRLLQRFGLYRLVWHRPLFDLATFVILLGVIAALANRILA